MLVVDILRLGSSFDYVFYKHLSYRLTIRQMEVKLCIIFHKLN